MGRSKVKRPSTPGARAGGPPVGGPLEKRGGSPAVAAVDGFRGKETAAAVAGREARGGAWASWGLAACVALVGVCTLLYLIAQLWVFTVDDAFITLRYAANFAAGAGPTFNPGDPPVEGYTSFAWMVLATLPHLVGADAVFFVKGLGVIATAGTVWATVSLTAWLMGERFSRGSPTLYLTVAVAVFMLGTFHATAVHAVSGMETALATFLLTALAYAALRAQEIRWLRVAPALALLLGMTRPEANAVIPLLLGAMVMSLPRAHRRGAVWACALLYVLPGAAYFAWRWSYYGLMFPVPFYLKVEHEGGFAGAQDVYSYLELMAIQVGILVALASLGLRREVLGILGVFAVWCGVCVMPAPVMGYEWRYCYPATPLLFSVAAYGFGLLLRQPWGLGRAGAGEPSTGRARRESLGPVLLTLAVLIAIGAGFMKTAQGQIRERRSYGMALRQAHAWLGGVLSEFVLSNRPLPTLAIGDAGAAPYYSRWRVIDTAGLNERTIGTTGDHSPELVFSKDPDLIALVSVRPDRFEFHREFPWETELYEACVSEGMVRIAAVRFSAASYLWLMAKPTHPLAKPIRRRLFEASANRGKSAQGANSTDDGERRVGGMGSADAVAD